MGLLSLAVPAALIASSRDASRERDTDIERGADDDTEDDRPALATRTQPFGSARGAPTLEDFLRSAHKGRSQNHGLFGRMWTGLKRSIFAPEPPEKDMVPDYRLLPILSGIVVPFSILLEVPGLLERWYIRTSGGHTVEVRNNPMILTVGMGISMACGVLANVFLLMRFLEKRPRSATLAAIVALTLHDIINIITVTVFGVVHRVDDGFTYGESFWITVCSTIASTFVNITLIYDFHTTTDFATKGSGLTRKQRSLVIVIMIFLVYVAFGASINHAINDLNFVNSLYFTIVSVTTIGYGDIVPTTTGARIFNAFYIVGGILNLSLVLVIARETIVEVFEQGFRRRKHALAERRKQHRRHRFEQVARRQAIERQLENAGFPVYVEKRSKLTGKKVTKLNEKVLTKEQMCDAIEEAQHVTEKIDAQLPPNDPHRSALGLSTPGSPGTPALDAKLVAGPSESTQQQTVETTGTSSVDGATGFVQALQQELGTAKASWEAQEESYRQFQAQIEQEESKDRTAKLVVAWSIFLTFWLVGAAIFSETEGWTYGIGLWWSFVTFSTIGFGDFSPTSPAGRAVFAAWALFGVAAMTVLISVLGETYANRYHSLVRDQAFERAMQNIRDQNAPNANPTGPAASIESLHEDGDKLPKSLAAIHDTLGQISTDMITCARRLHEDLHFLSTASAPDAVIPPDRLEAMLRDVEELNVRDGKLKEVLMQDTAAKKTLFMLGYENRLRKLIDQAELLAVQLAHKTDEIRETDELLQRYGELRNLFSSDLNVSHSDPGQQLTRRTPFTRGDNDDEESDPNLLEAEPTARTSALRASVSRSISRSRSRAS